MVVRAEGEVCEGVKIKWGIDHVRNPLPILLAVFMPIAAVTELVH